MNRPTPRQLRRIAIHAAAIAAVEDGVDQLETVATSAGLRPTLCCLLGWSGERDAW